MIFLTPDFWFSTFWGALYLGVLLALMVPALFVRRVRLLAASMLLLEIVDRISVTYLPPEKALTYLAFGYFLIAVYLALGHPQIRKNLIVAFFLTIVSAALISGSFGWIDWDATGTVQESCGLFAMLTIIWPRRHGSRVSDGKGPVAPAHGEYGHASGTLAARQAAEDREKADRSH